MHEGSSDIIAWDISSNHVILFLRVLVSQPYMSSLTVNYLLVRNIMVPSSIVTIIIKPTDVAVELNFTTEKIKITVQSTYKVLLPSSM